MLSKILDRAQELIQKPHATWQKIKQEETTVAALFVNYAAILVAFPVVAMIIGYSAVGVRVPMEGWVRWPLSASLLAGVVYYVLWLIGVYLGGYIIDYLAPHFDSKPGLINSMKLVVYAATPFWLAGVFNLVPALGFLSIVGFYSVYLLYLGLPVMMETPVDKALPYIITTIVIAIVIAVIVNVLVGQFIYGSVSSRVLPY
ncbi:MAG: Yip1 family protein [Candidatus Margulisiibacteriota bacterium]